MCGAAGRCGLPNSIAGLESATLLALCGYPNVNTGADMKLSELLERIGAAVEEMSDGGKRLRVITIKEIANVLAEFNKRANHGNRNAQEQIDELESRLSILIDHASEKPHQLWLEYHWVRGLLRKLRMQTCFGALVEQELELYVGPVEITDFLSSGGSQSSGPAV